MPRPLNVRAHLALFWQETSFWRPAANANLILLAASAPPQTSNETSQSVELVVMALVTTMMTSPILNLIGIEDRSREPVDIAAVA
jgi:hypothetical protein